VGPSRFVVSIRVSKTSQVGDAAARRLSRVVPVSPGSRRPLGDEHTPPAQRNSRRITELEADYPGKEASTSQKLPQRFMTGAPRARGSAQLQPRR
jgi:hypothetical protein